MVICFIIIKITISYEFITLTHKMMIGELHTYPIDLYVKVASELSDQNPVGTLYAIISILNANFYENY